MEAYDGQSSELVFWDQNNKPLTLFEVQRDSWLQYSRMSKEKLSSFIRNLCNISDNDINTWKSTVISREGLTQIGNIQVKAAIHTKETQDPKHVMHCKRYTEVKTFCNEFNCDSVRVWRMQLCHRFVRITGLLSAPIVFKNWGLAVHLACNHPCSLTSPRMF